MADCNGNIAGIEKVFVAEITGDTLSYYYSGDTIVIDENTTFNEIVIEDELTSFTQKKVSDTKGVYYAQALECTINNSQTDTPYDYLNKNLVAIVKDFNGYYWIGGMEQPFGIDKIESKNEKDNITTFTFSTNSYDRMKQVLESSIPFPPAPPEPELSFISTNSLFNFGSATGATFAMWFNFDTTDFNTEQIIFERDYQYRLKKSASNLFILETCSGGTVWFTGATTSIPLSASTDYFIYITINAFNHEINVVSPSFGGEGVNGFSFDGFKNEPTSNLILYPKNKNIKSFGIWNKRLDEDDLFFDIYSFHTPKAPVLYSELQTYLKDHLIAYYENDPFDADTTLVIEDSHTNNLDLNKA
jgi:hypothetical protein